MVKSFRGGKLGTMLYIEFKAAEAQFFSIKEMFKGIYDASCIFIHVKYLAEMQGNISICFFGSLCYLANKNRS